MSPHPAQRRRPKIYRPELAVPIEYRVTVLPLEEYDEATVQKIHPTWVLIRMTVGAKNVALRYMRKLGGQGQWDG